MPGSNAKHSRPHPARLALMHWQHLAGDGTILKEVSPIFGPLATVLCFVVVHAHVILASFALCMLFSPQISSPLLFFPSSIHRASEFMVTSLSLSRPDPQTQAHPNQSSVRRENLASSCTSPFGLTVFPSL